MRSSWFALGILGDCRSTSRTGVLLPEVQGVTTAEEQVDIALRKGGIRRDEPFKLFRFEVIKLKQGQA